MLKNGLYAIALLIRCLLYSLRFEVVSRFGFGLDDTGSNPYSCSHLNTSRVIGLQQFKTNELSSAQTAHWSIWHQLPALYSYSLGTIFCAALLLKLCKLLLQYQRSALWINYIKNNDLNRCTTCPMSESIHTRPAVLADLENLGLPLEFRCYLV